MSARIDVDRLARALPDPLSRESAEYIYGAGTDPLDTPQEWYMTPRELAAEIIANLDSAPDPLRKAAEQAMTRCYSREAFGSCPEHDALRAALDAIG